jgi:polyhydroxyalkanoate synthesis regulator phasin
MMPKKKNQETQEEQSERFRQTVRDLVAAGELNPIEADNTLDAILRQQKQTPTKSI